MNKSEQWRSKRDNMKFKKIETSKQSQSDEFTVDDVKMVRLSFTFPVWKNASVEDILSEFNDADACYTLAFGLEEAKPTLQDLEKFNTSISDDWYLYHRELDVTVKDIIENSKKSKKK
jgi:hypothetical protein